MSATIEQHDRDVLIRIKVVPSASRSQLAGTLGDRLKLRVAAPPEAGKANQAVCELLANALNIKRNQVTIEAGHTNPEKTVRITNINVDIVRAALT